MCLKITNTSTTSKDDVLYLTVEMKNYSIKKLRTTSLSAFLILLSITLYSCKEDDSTDTPAPTAFRQTQTITYDSVSLDVVIDKPAKDDLDVLLVFHGTVASDSEILSAANNTLDRFKAILDRNDMMIVSVAYPQENLLFGDNIVQCEAALLWLKNKASQELGITVNKIFLGGHSQGGYMVTRLNTMHQTHGVIANAPGPLNLVYRCQLEENGQIQPSSQCALLNNVYGPTSSNPNPYFQRSLLNFSNGFMSDIIFFQGLSDSPIQLYSWPSFKQDVQSCTTCQNSQFVEIAGGGHAALFESTMGKTELNNFINSH